MQGNDRRPHVTPQAVVGLCIIVAGLLLTADNLGLARTREVFAYFWPAAIAAVGVTVVRRASDVSAQLIGGLLITVGVALAAAHFFGWPLKLSRLWPLWLVVAGGAMLARALRIAEPSSASADQHVSDVVFWSGVQRRITSPAFKRADVTAVMGGVELDLRGASTGGGEAVLDVFIVMGGLEVRVPPDWTVTNQVVAIMGGASDKTGGFQDARNRLLIRGFVMMGGVEVKT